MKPWQKYTFGGLTAVLAITGIVYFWMKYMMTTDDPFAVVNHPWQPMMLQVHILAAPAFLVVFGIIFNSHIGQKIGKRIPNRRSGLLSLATLVLMTGSGYASQITTGETARQAWLVAHLGSGVVFTLAYVTHLAISMMLWTRERRAGRQRTAA